VTVVGVFVRFSCAASPGLLRFVFGCDFCVVSPVLSVAMLLLLLLLGTVGMLEVTVSSAGGKRIVG
jgi:hypothetical protein